MSGSDWGGVSEVRREPKVNNCLALGGDLKHLSDLCGVGTNNSLIRPVPVQARLLTLKNLFANEIIVGID